MARVMMALGEYRFSIDTAAYQQLQRTSEYRWPSQDRIDRSPALQSVGPGPDSIKLSGSIFPQFRGGLGQVDDMREHAGRGDALLLVDGRGRVWGRYCIVRVEETQTVFLDDGVSRKIDFKLDLSAYGDDAGAGEGQASSVAQEILATNKQPAPEAPQIDMSSLMAQSNAAASEPLPGPVESGLGGFDGQGLSSEGAILASGAGMSPESALRALDTMQVGGFPQDEGGQVLQAVASMSIRGAQGVGAPSLGSLPASPALDAFAAKTGVDPISAALERTPGSIVGVAEGLHDLGVNPVDFAKTVAEDPEGAILGVADRLKRAGPSEVFRVAEKLAPGGSGELLAKASADLDKLVAAAGRPPESWPSSKPDPTFVDRMGNDR